MVRALTGPQLLRGRISPRGDQVLFGRQSNLRTGRYDPAAGTVWVVASDGTGLRRVGTPVYVITSAVWDPSGRFIAYAWMADSSTSVLRVVEVATGAERGGGAYYPVIRFVIAAGESVTFRSHVGSSPPSHHKRSGFCRGCVSLLEGRGWR